VTAENGSPSFADLVRAHHDWILARNGGERSRIDTLESGYRQILKEFCGREGDILEAYWCTSEASAVVLTKTPPTLRQKLLAEQPVRLQRVTNWVMPRQAEKLVELLHDCDELAIRAEEILRGTPRRIALRSTYEIVSEVLAFVERTNGAPTPSEIAAFAGDAELRIRAARRAYEEAAEKVARLHYVSGMVTGVILLAPLTVLASLLVWTFGALHLHTQGNRAFFACIAAGALGAVVSVLSRMASPGKFGIDPEVGRRAIFMLGLYRPFVGSIFGLALYYLLQTSLLAVSPKQQFATFVIAAFLGGFSERFAKVMLNNAEKPLSGASTGDDRMAKQIEHLERLHTLHASGVLDDDEYARQKAKVLGG